MVAFSRNVESFPLCPVFDSGYIAMNIKRERVAISFPGVQSATMMFPKFVVPKKGAFYLPFWSLPSDRLKRQAIDNSSSVSKNVTSCIRERIFPSYQNSIDLYSSSRVIMSLSSSASVVLRLNISRNAVNTLRFSLTRLSVSHIPGSWELCESMSLGSQEL